MINVNNASLPPQEGEETLDAQWTSGIAPGAKIRI
jgi:kumamolisin